MIRITIMTCLLVATCAFAQQEQRVRVHYKKEDASLDETKPTKRIVFGLLESLSADQMVLRLKERKLRIPLGTIEKVERYKGEKTKIKRGMLVGCGLGAIGFLAAATGQELCFKGGDAEASCDKIGMDGATSLAVLSVGVGRL